MRLLSVFVLALVTVVTSASAYSQPVGVWVTKEGKSLIHVAPCKGQGRGSRSTLCSKIIWLKKPFDERGEPLRDKINTNPRLRKRTILGMEILFDMRPNGKSWEGSVYNPEDGKIYKAQMFPQGRRKMLVKGCAKVLFSWVCREQLWHRASEKAIRDNHMAVEPALGRR